MTQPSTRATFKDYCKRKLGWPVVELNLDDDQVEDCIDDSLQFFQEYHFDGTENTYLKHQISASTLKLAGAPTGTFTDGEKITGGTSGVQATVHEYHSANTTLRFKNPEVKSGGDGNTYYANTSTVFGSNETITGDTSSATATTTNSGPPVAIGDFDNKYIAIAEAIIGVRRIVPFYDNSRSNSMFSSKYQFALNEMHQLGTGLVNFEISQEHLMLINEMFTGNPMFRFQRHMDRLHLDINWGGDVDIDDWIIVECDKIIDPDTYTDIWSDMFLKQYNTALMKKQWGQNLIKFEGLQLPGGVTMNVRQMYDDATAELERIGEEMQLRYELPVDHLIG